MRTNNVRTKPDGTRLDFAFVKEANPTTTAALRIERDFGKGSRHEAALTANPFAIREIDEAPHDIVFADRLFPEGTSVVTNTQLYDWSARYRYAVLNHDRFKIRLGGGASYQQTELGLALSDTLEDDLDYTYARDQRLVPYVHLQVDFWLIRDFQLLVDLDSWDTSSFDFFNDSYILRYHVGPRWDLNLGFRRFERNLDSASLTHELKRDGTIFAAGYSF